MRSHMKAKLTLTSFCLVLLVAVIPVSAQVSTPYVFTSGTVASPDEVNANFAKFADALNRTGGTMTGTLTSRSVIPSATNTYDLGSAAALFQSAYLRTSAVLGQTTANYTLTWANPAAARAISIADPGGTDVFTFNAATQTLTNKTLTAPVLSGTVTGTYTLGGTPSIAGTALTGTTLAANIVTSSLTTVGTVTSGTWSGSFGAVSGANLTSLSAGNLSGTITSATQDLITRTGTLVSGTTGAGFTVALATSTMSGDLPDANLSANVALLNAANTFTALQTWSVANTEHVIKSASASAYAALIVTRTATGSLSDWEIAVAGNAAEFVATSVAGDAIERYSGTKRWANGSTERMTLSPAGLLTVSGFGTHSFSAGGTGANSFRVRNTTAGTGNYASIAVGNDTSALAAVLQAFSTTFTTAGSQVANGVELQVNGAGGFNINASDAAGTIGLWTVSTKRFAVNAAGDWLYGSNIMDSTGTPTIASGGCTTPSIAGTDYAFDIVLGTACAGGNTQTLVSFGRTWTTAPICTVTQAGAVLDMAVGASTSTTQVAVNVNYGSGDKSSTTYHILCRSY